MYCPVAMVLINVECITAGIVGLDVSFSSWRLGDIHLADKFIIRPAFFMFRSVVLFVGNGKC